MNVSLNDVIETIQSGGITALLIIILWFLVWGGINRWYVFGWTYAAEERRSREWKFLAMRGTGLANEAIELAEDERQIRGPD